MRLIDADALMERMTKAMEGGSNLNGTFHLHIEHAPTMDAVEVVRCKDCKYWGESFKGCKRNPRVEAWYRHDFCAYGERRES